MCGRFARPWTDQEIADHFGVAARVGPGLPPSWNVAPTQPVRLLVAKDGARTLVTARWGLVPHWAKSGSIGARMINARVETVLEKPAFRVAAQRRRAIVPMSGYYEWQVGPPGPKGGKGAKTPIYLSAKTGEPLAAAAIFEWWHDSDPAGGALLSFSVITTAATDTLGHIHDRAPLLLPSSLYDDWLDSEITKPSEVAGLLAQITEPQLLPVEVGTAVGKVQNDGPDLIRPVADRVAHTPLGPVATP